MEHLQAGLGQQEMVRWEMTKAPGKAICFRSPKSTHMPASHSQNGFRELRHFWDFLPMSQSMFRISSPLWTCVQGFSSTLLPTNSSTLTSPFHEQLSHLWGPEGQGR